MVFQPTENRTPSATATTGEPSRAKMSMPWCQATSARAAPHVSLNDACASTGKTYGAPSSVGVPLSSGAAVSLASPAVPLAGFGAEATRGTGRCAVMLGTDARGARGGAVVATDGAVVVSAGAVVGSWGSVSTVVTVSVVVVVSVVVSHSPGVSAVVVVSAGSGSSQ